MIPCTDKNRCRVGWWETSAREPRRLVTDKLRSYAAAHRLRGCGADGSRVYEFHPWEKNIRPTPPYNYVDVPIYEYLEELAARGENIRDYRTIWYYY